jgi:hypothetical protein
VNRLSSRIPTLPLLAAAVGLTLAACAEDPTGLATARQAATTVEMDFFHRPLPEIPLPNDLATRYDPSSPTGRRLNASMLAPTQLERRTRELLDELDGWGTFQAITIPFTGPLDVQSILDGHRDADYASGDDVVYLVDLERGEIVHLDLGNGNYPMALEALDKYGPYDPRGWTLSLFFEEADEDLDGDGLLDPGEDTDADGVLDRPNYLPGANPARDDLAGRADALMTFYERETDTLIARPLVPLRERSTYAVVVTRRLLDADGQPVGSPYAAINHNDQTAALRPLPGILAAHPEVFGGLTLDDVAFAFTFTTQTVQSGLMAVRDGLHGHGAQAHLNEAYPPVFAEITEVIDTDRYPDIRNAYNLQTEFLMPVVSTLVPALGGDVGPEQGQALVESHQYIDFHVIGAFDSPQLFDRFDEEGNLLPWNDQSWPPDLDRVAAEPRTERIYFWLAMPRREASARGENEPVPLIVYAHGYTSNHFDALAFAGFFAQHGVATLGIDNVSHGIQLSEEDANTYQGLADLLGLGAFLRAVLPGRALDFDGDGDLDSGEDYFTAYAFHTRDVARQGVTDYMQLMRIVETFDGESRWAFDLDADGENDLAGDFDADGFIDVGGDAPVCALGISLGSFMAQVLGAVEPNIDCVAAVLPGGSVTDISVRSLQGGVPEAFGLRVMGPLYLGATNAETDTMTLTALVPSGNDGVRRDLARVQGVRPGDTLVVENLANGERGCGYVSAEGTVRAAAASDAGDAHRVTIYAGDALIAGTEHCEVRNLAVAREVVDRFGQGFGPDEFSLTFENRPYERGSDLVALADGFAFRRASPSLRRLVTLSQAILDPLDPVNYVRFFHGDEPLTYESTGETVRTHALLLGMVGDMSVPTANFGTLGRAWGRVSYLEPDPRYGAPVNQVLVENHIYEGVHLLNRFQYGVEGEYPEGVHMDVENFSQGEDLWGDNVPRLDPPLRLAGDDGIGGESGIFFAYARPYGEHGFPLPLELQFRAEQECLDACGEDPDCDCSGIDVFDPAFFYFNMIGHYLATGGGDIATERCMADNDCRCNPATDGANCVGWPEPPDLRRTSSFNR